MILSSLGNYSTIKKINILSYSIFGLILVVDQLVLPMFHLGNLPYKVSYFLLLFWFVSFLIIPYKTLLQIKDRNLFFQFSLAIGIIIFCGIIGDTFVNFFTKIDSLTESFKSYTTYFFVILSFGLGLSSKNFNFKWLLYTIFFSISINWLFIFYKSGLPQFLIDFYYPEMEVQKLNIDELDSVKAILELNRPRGMFSNPNGSAFMINIIALFICIALRKGMLVVKSRISAILLVFLPFFTCVLLSSRGEIIVSLILGYFNYKYLFKDVSLKKKVSYIFVVLFSLIITAFLVLQKIDSESSFSTNIDRAYSIFKIFSSDSSEDVYEQRNQGITRPLLMIETAGNRFLYSPLFGSGFNAGHSFPFDHGTQFYHNDWLRLLVTSGLIGIISMIWIIRKFCTPVSFLLLIPFLLPGLVNTFLLNIPVVIFYFFMVGVMNGNNANKI